VRFRDPSAYTETSVSLPHAPLLRQLLAHNPVTGNCLDYGPSASDKLEDKDDCGNNQQQMDQTATHATYQSQQPEHNKYRQNCPQHCSLLLRVKARFRLSQTLLRAAASRYRSRFDEMQGVCHGRLCSICRFVKLFAAAFKTMNLTEAITESAQTAENSVESWLFPDNRLTKFAADWTIRGASFF
jgi:hypothetical protein